MKRRKSLLRLGIIALVFGSITLQSMTFKDSSEPPPLFPFLISYDSPDNIVNMSYLLEDIAGENGFIRTVDGHFANDLGPVRLNGTNLTGPANFPTHEEAERLAERLARFGINCVRLHYLDQAYGNFLEETQMGLIAADKTTQRNLDPTQLDKLDFLISQLKNKGIYVNINLHVGRDWDERDGFIDKKNRPKHDKGLNHFEPRMIELQKEYATKLLTHVNPYTKTAYRDEPAVAMVEINNESGLINQYLRGLLTPLPAPYRAQMVKLWNEWLKKKYGNSEKLYQAWQLNENTYTSRIEEQTIDILHYKDLSSPTASRDFLHFLYDTEAKYWKEMYDFLRKDLQVKSLVSGGQLSFTPTTTQTQLDFIDNHSYWTHPSINKNWKIKNASMVNTMQTIRRLAGERVEGYPYTISEYNHPFPNQYGAEGQPILRAYGRLQGWDGVFQYTYNHRQQAEPDMNTYFFSMAARTDVLAHMPACAAIFLRGDVSEAKDALIANVKQQEYVEKLLDKRSVILNFGQLGIDTRSSLVHRVAIDYSGKDTGLPSFDIEKLPNSRILVSDNGELLWNTEIEKAGYFTINTKNTKMFSGFPAGRTIQIGELSMTIGRTRLEWATISLVSKSENGFGEDGKPSQILLTATGLSENKGMKTKILPKEMMHIEDWGTGPTMVEGIPATISIPADVRRVKCYALDERGERKKELEVVAGGTQQATFEINPDFRTIWYEIEIK